MADAKRQTVSEFIRDVKPDWEHVKTREKQATTRPFSGCPVVRMPGPNDWTFMGKPCVPETAAEQMKAHDRQNLGEEEPLTFWDEKTVEVDDFGQEVQVVGKIGSRMPR